MAEKEPRLIEVKDGTVIADYIVEDDSKSCYVMTADITDENGETEKEQVILIFPIWFDEKPEDVAKEHVSNILGIQARSGGRLDNIKLFNLTVEEAETRGYLTPPEVIIMR